MTGQQDDYDYQHNKEEEFLSGRWYYKWTPTDNSDGGEDNEPDNNAP